MMGISNQVKKMTDEIKPWMIEIDDKELAVYGVKRLMQVVEFREYEKIKRENNLLKERVKEMAYELTYVKELPETAEYE